MDPNEVKCQLLINKRKGSRLKHFNDSKAFVDYSNDIDYIYQNTEEYNQNKKMLSIDCICCWYAK